MPLSRASVFDFVVAHLLDNASRTRVLRRQLLEMAVEMLLDLALGLSHETQVAGHPCPAGQCTQRKLAQIP